jgi:formate hydrogenlyase subunit 6/NADH:ubiquinone oxidoreductase subunit I
LALIEIERLTKHFGEVTAVDREGRPVRLQRPRIEPGLCVGCGLCEAKCPITDIAAVRITRIGESRETGSSFRLAGTATANR